MTCSTPCDCPGKYYVGDIGTIIIIDVCSDITTATLMALDVTKPDGTTDRWVGSLSGSTSIQYVVDVDDFDQAGEYRVQSYIEMPNWSGHGDTTQFTVSEVYQ